jgi:hypothetical protein
MTPLSEIGPYSESEWRSDKLLQAGRRLACPNCDSDVYFKAYGTTRGYRGCKVCGFWQEADGVSQPYRCHATEHVCVGDIPRGAVCGCCEKPGPISYHLCWRVLTPREVAERSYTCSVSGTVLGVEHVIPWAVEAP